MRRALAAAVMTTLVLAGCGSTGDGEPASDETTSDETTSTSPSPSETAATESPSADPTPSASPTDDDAHEDAIEIEIEGSKVEPNGKRVKVQAGETIRLAIESDRAGELHVHSTPEQVLAFKRGESVVELTIDTPGVVDVEEHEAHKVLLQLEVR